MLFEWKTQLGYLVLSVSETAILAPLLAWQQSGNHLLQQPKPGTHRSCWRALLLRSQHGSAAKHDYSQMDEPGGRLQPSAGSPERESMSRILLLRSCSPDGLTLPGTRDTLLGVPEPAPAVPIVDAISIFPWIIEHADLRQCNMDSHCFQVPEGKIFKCSRYSPWIFISKFPNRQMQLCGSPRMERLVFTPTENGGLLPTHCLSTPLNPCLAQSY